MWMSDQTLWTTRRFLWTVQWTALWRTSAHLYETNPDLAVRHP